MRKAWRIGRALDLIVTKHNHNIGAWHQRDSQGDKEISFDKLRINKNRSI